MNNFIPTDWRFVPVEGKRPVWTDWTNRGVSFGSVPEEYGFGLILGPPSAGTVAIDFDGPQAMDFFQETFHGIDLGDVPVWTSGKADRCQVAFRVPETYWQDLKTIKVGPGKTLEFRWTGSQSVLPPSPHPETGFYRWEVEPTATNTNTVIPDEVLAFWLTHCRPVVAIQTPLPEIAWPEMPMDSREAMVRELLAVIQTAGVPAYDDWRNISWAVASELGRPQAEQILRDFFPEQKIGEYRSLFIGFANTKAPKMGTLVHKASLINDKEVEMIKSKYRQGSYLAAHDEILRARARKLFRRKQL